MFAFRVQIIPHLFLLADRLRRHLLCCHLPLGGFGGPLLQQLA